MQPNNANFTGVIDNPKHIDFSQCFVSCYSVFDNWWYGDDQPGKYLKKASKYHPALNNVKAVYDMIHVDRDNVLQHMEHITYG